MGVTTLSRCSLNNMTKLFYLMRKNSFIKMFIDLVEGEKKRLDPLVICIYKTSLNMQMSLQLKESNAEFNELLQLDDGQETWLQ